MTTAKTARELYDRIRRDSGYSLSAYRVVVFVSTLMKRDPFDVLRDIGEERVAADDVKFDEVQR